MTVTLVKANTIPTEDVCEGREFVFFDTFISHFKSPASLIEEIKSDFKDASSHIVVEKYMHDEFVRRLNMWVFEPRRKIQEVRYTPIVTTDGWVYWTKFGSHQFVLRALSRLYSRGESEDPDFVFREGLCWQISGEDPRKLFVGDSYKRTAHDREVFTAFDVQVV